MCYAMLYPEREKEEEKKMWIYQMQNEIMSTRIPTTNLKWLFACTHTHTLVRQLSRVEER